MLFYIDIKPSLVDADLAEVRCGMLHKSLRALARYAPIFEKEGFTWGRWNDPKHPQVMPYFVESDEASAFIEDAYKRGWVIKNFPWSEWIASEEAVNLRGEPGAVGAATADQLGKLLTSCIRGDRFREGVLAEAYDSGLLTHIARRAMVLIASGPSVYT